MMEEFEKRLCDYFTAAELVELLGISVQRIVQMMHEDDLIDDEDVAELEEIMDHGG
jgi:hypothetical protein